MKDVSRERRSEYSYRLKKQKQKQKREEKLDSDIDRFLCKWHYLQKTNKQKTTLLQQIEMWRTIDVERNPLLPTPSPTAPKVCLKNVLMQYTRWLKNKKKMLRRSIWVSCAKRIGKLNNLSWAGTPAFQYLTRKGWSVGSWQSCQSDTVSWSCFFEPS